MPSRAFLVHLLIDQKCSSDTTKNLAVRCYGTPMYVGHFRRPTTQLSPAIPSRRFPKPWTVEPIPSRYRVIDANGIVLAHVYGQPDGAIAVSDTRLTSDEARGISKLISRLPELVELERDRNKARSRRKPQPIRHKPVTIGDLIREGKLLEVHCGSCRPERHLYLNPEILRLSKRIPVPEGARHLVCSKCGARNSETHNRSGPGPMRECPVPPDNIPPTASGGLERN